MSSMPLDAQGNAMWTPETLLNTKVCREMLEHVKDLGREEMALIDFKRCLKKDEILIFATPNAEIFPKHGFYFNEIIALLKPHFEKFFIFENGLIPSGIG